MRIKSDSPKWIHPIVLCLSISLVLAFAGCGGGSSNSGGSSSTKTLTSIAVSPSTATIAAAATQQFTATATYSDGTTANVSTTATWTSATTTVATISTSGLATAVAAGTSTITASLSGASGTAMLTVSASAATLTSIAVTPNPATIVVGTTQQFTATGTYSDGTTKVLTATWTSGTPSVATITAAGLATAVATGSATITATYNRVSGSAALTVVAVGQNVTSIAITPSPVSVTDGATQQLTAVATYGNGTTANVSTTATWTVANDAVASVSSSGLLTGLAVGSTTVTATLEGTSGNDALSVTIAAANAVSVTTWHVDTNRSGLNADEQSLTPADVTPQTFGKLFSYAVDGYAYAEPLLVSNVTIAGKVHNVLYVATEADDVYAFDADNYGSGAPLWQVSVLQSGETPALSNPDLKPYDGITSTPVIDPTTNTMYVVSKQIKAGVGTFRLNALDITTGAQKFGGPVTITASVAGTNSDSVGGVVSLTTSCIQRAALLLANGNVYMGFGGCHSGWLLAYNATTLAQAGVFNSSPNLDGEGTYASAGGVWMGSGGPVADSNGNVYVATGNGPWDGTTAFADSVLKFPPTPTAGANGTMQPSDYFTPLVYQYMDCNDADLAAGGLLMIPGTNQLLAGGKTGKLYLVNAANLGHQQANDSGAAQTLEFDSKFTYTSAPCADANGNSYTAPINPFEIFGTAAYFNGSVYLGITPTSTATLPGIGRFMYSGTLAPFDYTTPSLQENTRGTTPFISANGTANGILWMIDQGQPLGSSQPVTSATLRAYEANDLTDELYNSSTNPTDVPGYGIRFSSPVVANGKVYISTGHDLETTTNPQGEINVYGLN